MSDIVKGNTPDPLTHSDFWERYSGKRELLGVALLSHDPFDQFAWVQGWRFALCDYLYHVMGESVPEFRPASEPEFSYEFDEISYHDPNLETLWYSLEILDRYRVWLGMAGLDY